MLSSICLHGKDKINNFIDFAGVIQSVAAVPEIKKALGGLRVSSSSVAYTLKGKFKLHRLGLKELDTNNPLRKAIEDIVGGSKIDGDTLFRDLLIKYKKIVDPYLIDNKGNGL